MTIDEATRLMRLEPTTGPVHCVIDTDAYNELDDQFAIAYAFLSPERLQLDALYAAPFYADWHPRSDSPEEGMEKSYVEINRVLDLLPGAGEIPVHRGATAFLPDEATPVAANDAVTDLIRRAEAADDLLYVIAIGALTNIASALLRAPHIADKLVLVWLGSHADWWPHSREFNHFQDVPAVRAVYSSGIPVINIPCLGVASHLTTTPAELEASIKGKSAIGDFLCDLVCDSEYRKGIGWSRVIWDIATVAWLVNPDWVPSRLVHAPIAQDDGSLSHDLNRHFIRQAYWINRDRVFRDLFGKLNQVG